MVGPHGLDPLRQVHASRHNHASPIRPRSSQRQISRLDNKIQLRPNNRPSNYPVRHRRPAVRILGHLRTHSSRPARHMASKLSHALVGQAPLPNPRSFHKQLVGSPANLGRRLAQQSPRPPSLSPPRPKVVRNRFQLVRYLDNEKATPSPPSPLRKTLNAATRRRNPPNRSPNQSNPAKSSRKLRVASASVGAGVHHPPALALGVPQPQRGASERRPGLYAGPGNL